MSFVGDTTEGVSFRRELDWKRGVCVCVCVCVCGVREFNMGIRLFFLSQIVYILIL